MEGKCRSVQPSQNHSLTGKTQQFVHVMQRQHANTCGGILQLTEHQCVSTVRLYSYHSTEEGSHTRVKFGGWRGGHHTHIDLQTGFGPWPQ